MRRYLPVANRTCGECQACCTSLRIVELDSPEGERCSLLGESGCSQYEQRPSECAAYQCGWLQGQGAREHRPDRLGVIFSYMSSDTIGTYFLVHEVEEGALHKEWVQGEIDRVGQHHPVLVALPDERRSIWKRGPKEQDAKLKAMGW